MHVNTHTHQLSQARVKVINCLVSRERSSVRVAEEESVKPIEATPTESELLPPPGM